MASSSSKFNKFVQLCYNSKLQQGVGLTDAFEDLQEPFEKCSAVFSSEMEGSYLFSHLPALWPQIVNFPFENDTVLVATYPKSGTTWLQHILHLVTTLDFNEAQSVRVSVRVPFIELPRIGSNDFLEQVANRKPCLIKTHLPSHLLPKQWNKGKIIFVHRNAKDVAVSYFYHSIGVTNGKYKNSFTTFANDFLQGKVAYGHYYKHLLGFYRLWQQNQDKILFLRYEDLKRDLRSNVAKIVEFVGRQLSDEQIDKITEMSTFEAMKSNDACNITMTKNYEKPIDFVRKGIVGDWRNHFDQQLSDQFDKYIRENLPAELVYEDE